MRFYFHHNGINFDDVMNAFDEFRDTAATMRPKKGMKNKTPYSRDPERPYRNKHTPILFMGLPVETVRLPDCETLEVIPVDENVIDSFSGEFAFLSNFYPSRISYNLAQYDTIEHAYQAAKFKNKRRRKIIASCDTPGEAKRKARDMKREIRDDWQEVNLEVMKKLVLRKFTVHKDLRKKLLNTGERKLVEGNYWHDYFWGVCGGRGENHLGRILMEVRAELRNDRG